MTIKASTVAAILNASGMYQCSFRADDSTDKVWYVDHCRELGHGDRDPQREDITDVVDDWLTDAVPSMKEMVQYFETA